MQTKEKAWENENIVSTLKRGGIVVMPTDTIYGMVGDAKDPAVVEKIYKIRNRDIKKPCIVLIGDTSELKDFSIDLTIEQKNKLLDFWPGPVSVIFDCLDEKFAYLHRGTNTLAFRLPIQSGLQDLLKKTGPLIAPSANKEKFPESESIEDARNYFGNTVDLYLDAGAITSKASRVIKLNKDNSINILRE